MKPAWARLFLVLTVTALAGWTAAAAEPKAKADPLKSATTVKAAKPAAPLGPNITVTKVKDQAVVTYLGRQVYKGPATGRVSAHAATINGKNYAAAFQGETVLWENVPGAAKQLDAEETPKEPKAPSTLQVQPGAPAGARGVRPAFERPAGGDSRPAQTPQPTFKSKP